MPDSRERSPWVQILYPSGGGELRSWEIAANSDSWPAVSSYLRGEDAAWPQ
jgi:hypothetical protein